jgi:hypothetical protein
MVRASYASFPRKRESRFSLNFLDFGDALTIVGLPE